jgi:hypothetical protein
LPPHEIGRDCPEPRLGMRLIARGIMDLPPDRVLVVDMRRAISLSSPALRIRRLSPDAIALAMAN